MAQIVHLRRELAVLIGRLSPIPRAVEDLDRVRALIARCDALSREPEYRALSRRNMDFFLEITAMTGNVPLREISERLYFPTPRIWLLLLPQLTPAAEFATFRLQRGTIPAAPQGGHSERVGH